jgi:hypothetical protein
MHELGICAQVLVVGCFLSHSPLLLSTAEIAVEHPEPTVAGSVESNEFDSGRFEVGV